jgi:hypothetical protein
MASQISGLIALLLHVIRLAVADEVASLRHRAMMGNGLFHSRILLGKQSCHVAAKFRNDAKHRLRDHQRPRKTHVVSISSSSSQMTVLFLPALSRIKCLKNRIVYRSAAVIPQTSDHRAAADFGRSERVEYRVPTFCHQADMTRK